MAANSALEAKLTAVEQMLQPTPNWNTTMNTIAYDKFREDLKKKFVVKTYRPEVDSRF